MTLEVADFLPENHHIRRFSLSPWVEPVEELTDGQVELDLNFDGPLGGSGEMLSMGREGIADITICPPAYFPGEIPLGQVGNLPGTFLDTEVAREAFWNLTNDMLYEKELRSLNLRPVFVTVEAPYQAGSLTGDPIVSLDGWDGLSVRSTGGDHVRDLRRRSNRRRYAARGDQEGPPPNCGNDDHDLHDRHRSHDIRGGGGWLAITGATRLLINAVAALPVNRWLILGIVLVVYVLMSTLLDQLAILILTFSITFPLATPLGYNPIWFVILIAKTIEIGLVTSPFGLNVYVASGATELHAEVGFKGGIRFIPINIIIFVWMLFPQLVLFLPEYVS